MPIFIFGYRKTALSILCLFATLFSVNFLWAKTEASFKISPVIGSCPIKGGDLSKARGCAISSALVDAVELASIKLVSLDALVKNFDGLNEVLHRNSDLFVRDYKVLTESIFENVYRVLVQTTILSESLKQNIINEDLAHEIEGKETKRVLVIEGEVPGFDSALASEKELSDLKDISSFSISAALKQKGFFVIGKNSDSVFQKRGRASKRHIINLGKMFNADLVVISGIAVQKFNKSRTVSELYKGRLEVSAFSVKTGREIASLEKESEPAHNMHNTPDLREAVSNASLSAGGELASLIIVLSFEKETEQSIEVEIVADEKIFFPYFVMFKKHLKEMPGVSDIKTKEMTSNRAVLVTDFRGGADSLAKVLMGKKHDSFKLIVSEISHEKLKFKIRSK